VKSAGGGAAIAEAGGADDAGFATQTAGKKPSRNGWNHRAKVADHGVVAFTRTAAVNIAVAAAHRAELRTKIGAEGVEHGVAKSEAPGLVPDERSKNVALAEMDACGGAEGFLAAAKKDPAFDHSGAIEACEFFLQHSREKHHTVGLEVIGLSDGRDRLRHVPLVIEGRGCALQSIPSWTWLRRLVWLASGGIASRKRRHVDLLAVDYCISRSSVFWRGGFGEGKFVAGASFGPHPLGGRPYRGGDGNEYARGDGERESRTGRTR
jgi:hypothetical protein